VSSRRRLVTSGKLPRCQDLSACLQVENFNTLNLSVPFVVVRFKDRQVAAEHVRVGVQGSRMRV